MSRIFAQIAANSTSRTLPVFANAATTANTGSTAAGVAYQFALLVQPAAGRLALERQPRAQALRLRVRERRHDDAAQGHRPRQGR